MVCPSCLKRVKPFKFQLWPGAMVNVCPECRIGVGNIGKAGTVGPVGKVMAGNPSRARAVRTAASYPPKKTRTGMSYGLSSYGLSDCCNHPVIVSGPSPDFIGDDPKTMRIGTCHYICTRCGAACSPKPWEDGKGGKGGKGGTGE